MIFGSHIASRGGMVLFWATIFKASKENTKTKAKAIPMARLSPMPPLLFSEERDIAKMVRIMMATGIEVRW